MLSALVSTELAACRRAASRSLGQVAYKPASDGLGEDIEHALDEMRQSGTFKNERVLTSAQGPWIRAPLLGRLNCLASKLASGGPARLRA